MNNLILTVLVLGLLLMMLVAPFSGLALLMLTVFVGAIAWTVWQLLQAFVKGDP